MRSGNVVAALVAVLLVTSCTPQNDVEKIDGFKDLKFGLTQSDLKQMGINCEDDEGVILCSGVDGKKRTFLGQDARVNISINDEGQLEIIDVTIDTPCEEVIPKVSQNLGKASSYEYPTIFGGRATMYFWKSDNGNSLSLATISAHINNFCTMSYNDNERTKWIIEDFEKNRLNQSDL